MFQFKLRALVKCTKLFNKMFKFCFRDETKSFPTCKTVLLCFFNPSIMFGVRLRWPCTRAVSLFSRWFRIANFSSGERDRNPFLLCLEVLLFITSCQMTTLFLFFNSSTSKLCSTFFNFFVFVFKLRPGML